MREISRAVNLSADEFLKMLPPKLQKVVFQIRNEKERGARPRPSASLIDCSSTLSEAQRKAMLDKVASLVDENLSGRSDMCLQFADLLSRLLNHLKISARPVLGTAIYYGSNKAELFRWRHAWVRIGKEVIDGNVDCLFENPLVPSSVSVKPYWGPVSETPPDRRFRPKDGARLDNDTDVSNIWWPEMRAWLDQIHASPLNQTAK
jgi:hypothetical protein